MRIGILTLHSQINYGGVLQAYALQQALAKEGVACEVIDYWRSTNNIYLRGDWLDKTVPLGKRLCKLITYSIRYEFPLGEIRRCLRTIAFLKKHVVTSATVYKTADELAKVSGYDCMIVGSDQVWNYHWFGTPNPFLLGQIEAEVRRVAYAPSFGFSVLPEDRVQEYKDALSRFDALSIREIDDVSRIRKWTGREAKWVLDPTLLLAKSEWSELIGPPKSGKPFIFCYWIGEITEILNPLRQISRKTGMPVRLYLDAPRNLGRKERFVTRLRLRLALLFNRRVRLCEAAGPVEFAAGIRGCAGVLSNSFHAMMFSCVFEKPFRIFVEPSPERIEMSSRVSGFARTHGMAELVLFKKMSADDAYECPDYAALEGQIAAERKGSLDYLRSSLRV